MGQMVVRLTRRWQKNEFCTTDTIQTSSAGSIFVSVPGSKYHFVSICLGLGNTNSIFSVTLSYALSRGFALWGYEN